MFRCARCSVALHSSLHGCAGCEPPSTLRRGGGGAEKWRGALPARVPARSLGCLLREGWGWGRPLVGVQLKGRMGWASHTAVGVLAPRVRGCGWVGGSGCMVRRLCGLLHHVRGVPLALVTWDCLWDELHADAAVLAVTASPCHDGSLSATAQQEPPCWVVLSSVAQHRSC